MFLNVGGAVLGVAVLTVISDSVASNHGGKNNPQANLEGYRARYYAAIAMIAIGFIISLCPHGEETQEQQQQEEEQQEERENEGHESKEAEKKETPAAITNKTTSGTVSEESESETKVRERTVDPVERMMVPSAPRLSLTRRRCEVVLAHQST